MSGKNQIPATLVEQIEIMIAVGGLSPAQEGTFKQAESRIKKLESLPCYMAWFWNDGEPDPFPDCDCPVCEMKAKPDEC